MALVPDRADLTPGRGIVRLSSVGTGVLVATSLAGAASPDGGGRLHAAVSVVCFVAGTAALLWAYALGLARSRTDLVGIPGLFLLAGDVAPASARRPLRASVVVQAVVVILAASVRPYTVVAFGILAPMFGLGLMAVWGARHGTFPARLPRQVSRPPVGDGGECADG